LKAKLRAGAKLTRKLRPYDRSRCAEHSVSVRVVQSVPAAPGVVMVSPPEVPRNAEGAQSEDRARHDGENQRGQEQYKGRSPLAMEAPTL
jgi:hypothetical protein